MKKQTQSGFAHTILVFVITLVCVLLVGIRVYTLQRDDSRAATRPAGQTIPATSKTTADAKQSEQSSNKYWVPALQTSWQWQLSGAVDQSFKVNMYDIDLFDTTAGVVSSLQQKGSHVVCYINVGAFEEWRPDASSFPAAVIGKAYVGWQGERWLDIRQLTVLEPIMNKRLDQCKQKGFDAVEGDNVDGYKQDTGFPMSATDQLRFNTYLAEAAHTRGLSIGLKNDLEQIPQLVGTYDWALNEECFANNECGALKPFITQGKAVFNVEYNIPAEDFCGKANAMNFNSLVKDRELTAPRQACR